MLALSKHLKRLAGRAIGWRKRLKNVGNRFKQPKLAVAVVSSGQPLNYLGVKHLHWWDSLGPSDEPCFWNPC